MTKKGKGKKVLSLALTLVMVLTMIPAFTAGLFNRALALKAKAAGTTIGDLTFIVPEAIYLYPNGTSWRDSTSTPFQYYLNNDTNNSPITAKGTAGNIYWRYATAQNATLSWRFVDGSFNQLSGGSVTVNASTGLGTSKDISVTGGSSPSLDASTTGCWLEWCVSFTDTKDNQAKKAYAYTYVYKPYTVPVGGFVKTKNSYGNSHFAQSITWLSGVHSINTSVTYHDDGGYYPKYTTDRGLAGFISSDSTAYIGGSSVSGAIVSRDVEGGSTNGGRIWRSGATRGYTVFSNTDTGNVHLHSNVNDTSANAWGDTSYTADRDFNVKSFDYWYKDKGGENNVVVALTCGPQGQITIDTSRYSDLSQIPNLAIGLMGTDNEGGKYQQWHVSDHTDCGNRNSDYYTGSENRGTYYNSGNYIIAGQATDGDTAGKTDYYGEGVMYAGAWPRTILQADSNNRKMYTAKGWFAIEQSATGSNDFAFNFCLVDLVATQYNKTNLRAAVQRATSKMAALGVNGISSGALSSCYFDASSSNGTWTTLQNAYKAAVLALTKVDGTITNPDELANNLNSALNDLQTRVTLSGGSGTITAGPTTLYVTVGTNQKGTVSPDANAYAGNRPGYSLISADKRWSATRDASSGSKSVEVGYNDTIYAVWLPNSYNVSFDKNGASGSMSAQSIQYDSSAALTANAFVRKNTLTLNYNYTGSTNGTLDANYTFDGWDGEDFVNDAGPYSAAAVSNEVNMKQYTVDAPYGGFKTGDRYVFEFDASGSGNLTAFFYGNSGYRQIAKAECDNGQTSTATDGNMTLNLTSDNKHYVVTYTIGANGNMGVTKYLLLRAQPGANATISNIKAHRIFADQEEVLNLSTGNNYTLTARWLAPEKVTLPSAERPGYNFNGWYESKSGGTKFGDAGDEVALTANKTVYANWQAATYTITYVDNKNTANSGTVDYTYTTQNVSRLKAPVAPTGYTFAGWKVTATDGNWTVNSTYAADTYIKNLYGNVTLEAQYSPNTYTATIRIGEHGSISNAPTTVTHGGEYYVSISLGSGYDTVAPTIANNTQNCKYELTGEGSEYTLRIYEVKGDVNLYINPQITKYKVTVNTVLGVSLTTAEADLETDYNGTVTFTVELLEGYRNLTAKIGSTALSPKSVDGSAYTFEVKNIKSGVTVDVTAERIDYVVELASDCASFDLTSPQTVYYGENLVFTVTMNEGYTQTEPTVTATNGVTVEKLNGGNGVYTYQLKNVKAHTRVTVTGTLNKYAVRVNTDAGLEPIADASVDHGSDYTLTLTLKAAYNKTAPTATVDGEAIALTKVSDTVYTHTFTNVTGDINVSAASTLNTYDVTITGDAGCTLSDAAFNGVSHGDTVTFTVTLKEGYTKTPPVLKNGDDTIAYASVNDHTYTYTFAVVSDMDLTVETKLNVYIVRFLLPSGSELWSTTVEHGATPSYGGEMIETVKDDENHYVFNNEWTPAFVPATKDAVYTAVVTGEPHTWDEGEVTTQPTCTDAGVKTFTCTVCGATYTEPVNAKGHAYGAWTPNGESGHIRYCANDPAHKETALHNFDGGVHSAGFSCTDGGTITYTCLDCGFRRVENVAAGAYHQFGAWVTVKPGNEQHDELQRRTCVVCGAIQEQNVPFTGTQDQADPNVNGHLLKNRFNFWEWILSIFHRIANLFKGMKF